MHNRQRVHRDQINSAGSHDRHKDSTHSAGAIDQTPLHGVAVFDRYLRALAASVKRFGLGPEKVGRVDGLNDQSARKVDVPRRRQFGIITRGSAKISPAL